MFVSTGVFSQETQRPAGLRFAVFCEDHTIAAYVQDSRGRFRYAETAYWALKGGRYHCYREKSQAEKSLYLVVDQSGLAYAPALNEEFSGIWWPRELARGRYVSVMACAGEYPGLWIDDMVRVSGKNRETEDMPYSAANGILSFRYRGAEYRYACTANWLFRLPAEKPGPAQEAGDLPSVLWIE